MGRFVVLRGEALREISENQNNFVRYLFLHKILTFLKKLGGESALVDSEGGRAIQLG
jgi:hypothetical protein